MSPAALGILRALAGLVAGGVAVGFVLIVALLVSGDHSLTLHPVCAALLSLGFASVSTATIVALARGLRAPTLALVFAIGTFWTAAALPLWVAIPATLLTAFVLTADASDGGGARIGGRAPVAALAAAGAMLLIVAAATAEPRPRPKTTAQPGAASALLTPPNAARRHDPPRGTKAGHAKPGHDDAKAAAPGKDTKAPATPSENATPAKPGDAAAPAARPDAAEFVRTYYVALDKRRFADVWNLLSPAVKARFGTFANWRAGYDMTLASAPEAIKVVSNADGSAEVRNVLVARDRTKCGGTVEQRFTVTWKLVPAGSGWTVAGLSATAAGPASTLAPCP